jgi:hypothetical protein
VAHNQVRDDVTDLVTMMVCVWPTKVHRGAGVQPIRVDANTLCNDLITCWEHNTRSSRLATPLLKCLNVLLSRGVLDCMCLSAAHADKLVELVRGEGRKCSDAMRLICIADALCQLSVAGRGDVKAALQVCGGRGQDLALALQALVGDHRRALDMAVPEFRRLTGTRVAAGVDGVVGIEAACSTKSSSRASVRYFGPAAS